MTSLYASKLKEIYSLIMDFLENDLDESTNFYYLNNFIQDHKFGENKYELKEILKLISKISKNHSRNLHFINKIQQILLIYVDNIKQTFSNYEILQIFKNNKLLLLFLLKNKIVTLDQSNLNLISKHEKYLIHFLEKEEPKTIEKDDEQKLEIGENESYICKLIREDSIQDFISYVNKTNFPIKTATIESSIYETNSFLIHKNPTLIEYASFFGSIQIFVYLKMNEVELSPSLWLYSIHSNKPELIHLLEENSVEPEDKTYKECFKEAIKCHHNDIAIYIRDRLLNYDMIESNNRNQFYDDCLSFCFQFYNYFFFPENFEDGCFLFYLCQFDYFTLVSLLLNNQEIDLNNKLIFIKILDSYRISFF